MRFYFRPMLKPTLWCLPGFALLLTLGAWQIERLHWKEALIAQVSRNMADRPVTLPQILLLPPKQAQYRRVSVSGRFDHAKESYSYSIDAEGKPGFHVLTPLILAGGRALIVDRGAVPTELRNSSARALGQVASEQNVVGVWRLLNPPNAFTPRPDLRKRLWFARDVNALAKLDGLVLAAPAIVEADATPNPGGWPRGGQTVVNFPNNHLQYALTWFGLAAGLLAVYFAYHRSLGRLGFR